MQDGRRRSEQVRLGDAELDDRELAVGGDDVAGSVGGGLWDMRAIDQRVGGCGSSVEQIGFDPLALTVDVGIDAVSPLGVGSRSGDVDVVGGGADPYLAAVPGAGLFPDANVVALGKGVEGFLKDEVGRFAVDGEE